MKITPLEIDGHTFPRRFRGYDPIDVRAFLTLVSEEYEKLIVENNNLRDQVAKMQSILDEHRQREKILRETLYTAQQLSEEMKEQARREGKIIVQEARIQADRLLEQAQEKAVILESSLTDLRVEKETYLRKVRSLLDHHRQLLELHEHDATEEGKVHFLRRKGTEPTA